MKIDEVWLGRWAERLWEGGMALLRAHKGEQKHDQHITGRLAVAQPLLSPQKYLHLHRTDKPLL